MVRGLYDQGEVGSEGTDKLFYCIRFWFIPAVRYRSFFSCINYGAIRLYEDGIYFIQGADVVFGFLRT